jgi:hypothetical protein
MVDPYRGISDNGHHLPVTGYRRTMTLTVNITAFGPPSGAPEDIEELRMIASHVLALKKIIEKRGRATMNVSVGAPAEWNCPGTPGFIEE